MKELRRAVSLVLAIRDPARRDYESEELDPDGHTYLYRFSAREGLFLRATMPSGAAAPVFRPLGPGSKVPVEGWLASGYGSAPRPRLVKH